MDVGSRAEENDPFLEINASQELQELINHTVNSEERCGLDGYVNEDSVYGCPW